MTRLYYRPFRQQINNLEGRYFPDPKPFNIFCWYDQNGEVFEMFGVGFSWSRSRDGGDPPEITDEFIASVRAGKTWRRHPENGDGMVYTDDMGRRYTNDDRNAS